MKKDKVFWMSGMRIIFILMLVTGEPKSEHNGKGFKLVYKGQMSFG